MAKKNRKRAARKRAAARKSVARKRERPSQSAQSVQARASRQPAGLRSRWNTTLVLTIAGILVGVIALWYACGSATREQVEEVKKDLQPLQPLPDAVGEIKKSIDALEPLPAQIDSLIELYIAGDGGEDPIRKRLRQLPLDYPLGFVVYATDGSVFYFHEPEDSEIEIDADSARVEELTAESIMFRAPDWHGMGINVSNAQRGEPFSRWAEKRPISSGLIIKDIEGWFEVLGNTNLGIVWAFGLRRAPDETQPSE